MARWLSPLCLLWSIFAGWAALSPSNLVTNGGFEFGTGGWRPAWARQPGTITLTLDDRQVHDGRKSAHLEHRGKEDWSFEPDLRVPVRFGDVFEMEVWVRVEGEGSITLCASTWSAGGQNVDWSYAERTASRAAGWTRLQTRFVIPPGVSQLQPRLIGHGPVSVWVDDFALTRQPSLEISGRSGMPREFVLSNRWLQATVHATNGTFSVLDRRTRRTWSQQPGNSDMVVLDAGASGPDGLKLKLLWLRSQLRLDAVLRLEHEKPELTVEVSGGGEMAGALSFPHRFSSARGDYLVVPMNEGISYPVEDASIEPFRLVAYGGHGICMAFWGVTDGQQGHAAIIETPDDAAIRLIRAEGRLAIAPEWDSQKGQFGYARKLRYVFFDQGGHVAIAKRYREHVRAAGLLRTLAEKKRENPSVDLLVGAANIWNWDCEPVALVKEMQAAGMEHLLWSRGGSAEALRALNEKAVLTSRYDIYQDTMDPGNFPKLRWTHGDWTTVAWPGDIVLKADGDWLRGWGVEGKQGEWYYCGVLCDTRALEYARKRVAAELVDKPYRCRFIDTTTAAPWHECYSTHHPMTRTDSRVWKMKLLECMSREFHLVTGSETGHDAAVPFVHYFEGMLSLGPYRVPDSGRDMQRIWDEPPERVAKFQLGHDYRLPLWELVYHDCVVAQWYWGDYNNKLPSLWRKRDLFNVLYGTPPMYMFNRKLWDAQKARFAESYRKTCPQVRAVGYAEMTHHRFLKADRSVQETSFSNGTRIVVNFGDKPFQMPGGEAIEPLGFKVFGLGSK